MGKEIERKFLVVDRSYRDAAVERLEMSQGYISINPDATVRVRVVGERAFLTIKGHNRGIVRDEWEYSIPIDDARQILNQLCCSGLVEKTRYIVPAGDNLKWEVDEFHGRLEGLTIAEIELPAADTEFMSVPSFIGREVSDDSRYYNSALANSTELPPFE